MDTDGTAEDLLPSVVLKCYCALEPPGELVQTQIAGSHTPNQRIYISNKFPGGATAGSLVLEPHLQNY